MEIEGLHKAMVFQKPHFLNPIFSKKTLFIQSISIPFILQILI